ncbi:hypothetical protein DAI22_08g055000 [Oryza sativa Japonica Group]|nr:hypothetical protein DAI22_08g055000 [Oryza sativa Japonica Group]
MARPATPARLTPGQEASRAATSRCSWTRTAPAGFPLVAWPTSSSATRPSTSPGWARSTPATAVASRARTDTVRQRHSWTRTAPASFPLAAWPTSSSATWPRPTPSPVACPSTRRRAWAPRPERRLPPRTRRRLQLMWISLLRR